MALPATPTRLTSGADDRSTPAGTLQDQWIQGLGGDDTIQGGDGNDRIEGGDGEDFLVGGAGNDTLIAGGEGMFPYGRIDAGDGDDLIYSSADNSAFPIGTRIDGGAGYDTLVMNGWSAGETFRGVSSVETVVTSNFIDMLDFTNYRANDPAAGPQPGTAGYDVRMAGGVTVHARGGDDQVQGTAYADRIYGGDGNDHLHGNGTGSAADTLIGGAGDDMLAGGNGNDYLRGDAGYDNLFGGGGNDTFVASAEDGLTFIDFYNGGEGYDTLLLNGSARLLTDPVNGYQVYGIERFVGSVTDGKLDLSDYWTSAPDRITPGPHPAKPTDPTALEGVRVDAGNVNDVIRGTSYGDTINGGSGNDNIAGNDGRDILNGGIGSDTILAGAGNDVLIAGSGWDFMTGGAGGDRFDVRALAGGIDNLLVIHDFSKQDGDKVDLRGLGLTFASFTKVDGRAGVVETLVSLGTDAATGQDRYVTFAGLAAADISADMFLT